MQIETQTAAFRVDDIQAAYNDAVLSGRTLLAREIEQLWIGALANQTCSRGPLCGCRKSDAAGQLVVARARLTN